MKWNHPSIRFRLTVLGIILVMSFPMEALAYVDPGTTGMISQMLYVLFYGALGLFFYFLRYIKQYLARTKLFLKNLFSRQS